MVKVTGIPEQVPKDGVTVIVLTLFVVPEFKPLKERIELDPLMLVNPVLVLSLTQLKVAPEVPEKFIADVACPGQIV
jgi:hypothetical protein